MKTLTIVVPTYNVEKYLDQCLKSFVVPEIMNDLEVLIINDGSTDSSPQIGQRYVKQYPETFRLITKKNGGHGSTINKGIEAAAGKFFKVVDGDDWVIEDGFKKLMLFLKSVEVDMVLSNYYWVNDLTGKTSKEVQRVCPDSLYGRSVPFNNVSGQIFFKMHAITYRTEILRKIPDKIDEHCYYVDMEYMTFPLPYIKYVAAIPDHVYMYRIGLPTQSVNIENMRRRCEQHERVVNRLLNYYENCSGLSIEIKNCMEKIIARSITSQYKIYMSFKDNNLDKVIYYEKELKKKYFDIFQKLTNPAILLIRWSNYKLYYLISLLVRHSIK